MPYRRMRYDQIDCLYHLINRTAGDPNALPFTDEDKEYFFSLTQRLSVLYTIELISVVVMSNHYHIVCMAPANKPGIDEIRRRWRAFYTYRAGRGLEPNWKDPAIVEKWANKMRDISDFMKELQQRFSRWYNKTHGRQGPVWTNRFKNVILQRGAALYRCVHYVEMNPVRAWICADPAEYRFSTYGRYCATGHHPFAESAAKHLGGSLSRIRGDKSWLKKGIREIMGKLGGDLAATAVTEAGGRSDDVEAVRKTVQELGGGFILTARRRMRYWSDGAIIGSKSFVREVAAACWGEERARKKRLARAIVPAEVGDRKQHRVTARGHVLGLFAWRRFRVF
jgi:putative transposase